MNRAEEYEAQLQHMLARAQKWRETNRERGVLVQFNFPKEACVIATISQAIKDNFVSVNAAGLELIQALWPWNCQSEATVLMVRAVLEWETEVKK